MAEYFRIHASVPCMAFSARYPVQRLGPSDLVAHRNNCLVLLPSGPDTVHRFLLHKTQPFNASFPGQLRINASAERTSPPL